MTAFNEEVERYLEQAGLQENIDLVNEEYADEKLEERIADYKEMLDILHSKEVIDEDQEKINEIAEMCLMSAEELKEDIEEQDAVTREMLIEETNTLIEQEKQKFDKERVEQICILTDACNEYI